MSAGMKTVDFGQGPARSITGHVCTPNRKSVLRAELNGDITLRTILASEDLERLASSPVLPALAPRSKLLQHDFSLGIGS